MNKDAKVEGRNNDSNMSKKIEKARDVIGKELCATNNNNNNCGDNQNNNHACIIPQHDRGPYNYVPLPAPRSRTYCYSSSIQLPAGGAIPAL